MVKDVTKFYKQHLGGGGGGGGYCLIVCVCRVSYRILNLGGGELQSLVLTWRGRIAHNKYGGLGECSPDIYIYIYIYFF